MSLEIYTTQMTLGAVVRGVRLDALAPAEWRAIESAFHERAVLIFPGQYLSCDEQVAFGCRFGELDALVAETGTVAISNLLPDGRLRREDDPILQILRGNEGWHTDSSYMPLAAKASILLAAACQPPRILRHAWRPGDVAIWDNRYVLHRARPYDPSAPRVMHHTRIAGDPATEAALPG